MATAEQLKSLIRSHFDNDVERFTTIALQVAANEALQGHDAVARDIRLLVDQAKSKRKSAVARWFSDDLRSLALPESPSTPLASLVLPTLLRHRIDRIIHEYRQQQALKSHGLCHRRKILLVGPPGTGKTMTAQVLAHELGLTLFTIQIDKMVTKFMGETGAKLRQIFDLIRTEKGVYLFDEFDAIASERNVENDVGEMRRVLNALLQFIERDKSDSLIVAATNSPRLLDRAIFRRFDDVIYYELPDAEARKRLVANVLGKFLPKRLPWKAVEQSSAGLSHAEIDSACQDAIKQAILSGSTAVTGALLRQMLAERQSAYNREDT